jgi:hypothetical protein
MISNKELAGLIRYALSGLGMVYTVGKLIGMKPEDIIPSFRFGLPPTLKLPVEIGKSIIGIPDKYGNVPDTQERLQNIGKAVVPFIPAGTQIKKSVEGLTDVSKGFSETPKGLIKYPVEQNISNYVRGGLFGRHNLPEAQEYYKKERTPLSKKQSELVKSEGKQTYAEIMEKRDLSKEEKSAKEKLEESKGSPQAVGNKILYWDPESGSVKTLNFRPITKPKITGNAELDKIKISSYNSKIKAQIKDVAKLEELGQITSDEAEKKIQALKKTKISTGRKMRKPSLRIKSIRMPKIKTGKIKKIKIKKPKRLKKYALKTKKIKTAKIKLSKKLT